MTTATATIPNRVNTRETATVTLDIEDFYKVINAIREACGCHDCQRIANLMLEDRFADLKENHPNPLSKASADEASVNA